jgi:hypothetical protein
MIYTLFLALTDLFFNILINFIQGNPGAVIIATSIVRSVCLLTLFSLVAAGVHLILKVKWSQIGLITTTLVVYAWIPLIVYCLKSNGKSILEVYADLHFRFDLYALVYLPYVLASVLCVFLSNRLIPNKLV